MDSELIRIQQREETNDKNLIEESRKAIMLAALYAGAEEEIIKDLQAAEEINFVIEDHIEKAEEEIIRRSI